MRFFFSVAYLRMLGNVLFIADVLFLASWCHYEILFICFKAVAMILARFCCLSTVFHLRTLVQELVLPSNFILYKFTLDEFCVMATLVCIESNVLHSHQGIGAELEVNEVALIPN